MKIASFVLGFCLVATFVFAGMSAEIVSVDKDDNGNIRVWTQYKIDGVEVDSRYPKINGKQVYCTRYNKQNFLGMSKTEIAERIDKDLEAHSKTLIQKEFDKNANATVNQIRIAYNAIANQDFMDTSFPVLIGRKVTEEEATVALDTNNDGVQDKEIKVKTDGTYTENILTP